MTRPARVRRRHARPSGTNRIVKRKMETVMGEYKRGRLRSGSGTRVRSPQQDVAIGLSEARRAGARIPNRPRS